MEGTVTPVAEITGVCPQCGRAITVPEGLSEFSCLYCGARLEYDLLQEEQPPARLPEGLETLLAGRRGLLASFDREHYAGAFAAYEAACRPVLEPLLRCGGPQLAQGAALALDAFDAELRADPRWGSRRRRTALMNEARFLLAVYFAPMVAHQRLPMGAAFNEAVRAEWLRRYPGEVYVVGDYESIESEFHRRFKWLSNGQK